VSNSSTERYQQRSPWRDEAQVFRAAGVIVLLIFGVFVFYDRERFHQKHILRCRNAPELPECGFFNIPKPMPPPELGIVLDQGAGNWAIQLEPIDHEAVNKKLRRLAEAGASARLIKTTGRKKRVFYYVQLGKFKTQKDANEAGRQLKTRGLVTSFSVTSYRSASQ